MIISGKEISEETIKAALESYGISFDEPKPENWDYGINTAGCPYVVIRGRIMFVEEGEFANICKPRDSAFRNTAKGNLKRELKELAKPLEEFKVSAFSGVKRGLSARIVAGGKVEIGLDFNTSWVFTADQTKEISIKLRQLLV